MAIYLGGTKIRDLNLGSLKISEAYLGSQKIYPEDILLSKFSILMEPSLSITNSFTTPNGLILNMGDVATMSELEYDNYLNEDGFYPLTFGVDNLDSEFHNQGGIAYFQEHIGESPVDIPNAQVTVYNTADYNYLDGFYRMFGNTPLYHIQMANVNNGDAASLYAGHSIGRVGMVDSKGKEYKFEFRLPKPDPEPGSNFLKVQFLMPSGEPVGFGTVNNNKIQPISGLCISNDYKSSVRNQYMSLYGLDDTSSGMGEYPGTCAERMYQLASLDGYWNSDNSIGTTIDEVILNKGNYMSFLGTSTNEYGFCYPIYLPDLRDNGVLSSQNLAIANSYKMTDWHICFASFIENTNYNPSRWSYMAIKEQYEIGQTIKSVTYDNSTGLITIQFA